MKTIKKTAAKLSIENFNKKTLDKKQMNSLVGGNGGTTPTTNIVVVPDVCI